MSSLIPRIEDVSWDTTVPSTVPVAVLSSRDVMAARETLVEADIAASNDVKFASKKRHGALGIGLRAVPTRLPGEVGLLPMRWELAAASLAATAGPAVC